MTPPFFRIPAHVDGDRLFQAALALEEKLYARMGAIEQALAATTTPDLPPGYWVEWLHRKSANFLAYLQVYAYILAWSVPPTRPDPAAIRLLDFGGGWGLMGLLAKEAGFGRVTYLDIVPGITEAARAISVAVGRPFDECICGSESVLLDRPRTFDAVASSDVLEHVYSPARVFEALSVACAPGAAVMLHTGANPLNVKQRISLARLQRREEIGIRGERLALVRKLAPDLSGAEAESLADRTRGLDETDIRRAVSLYRSAGSLPTPDHPTNTCYLNGYWLERLMNPFAVAGVMAEHGFSTCVVQSFWGAGRSSLPKRLLKHSLNLASRSSRTLGLRLTYYYGVRGLRNADPPPVPSDDLR